MNYEIKLSVEEIEKVMMTKINHWSQPVLTLNAYFQNEKKLYILSALTAVLRCGHKVGFYADDNNFDDCFNRAVMVIEKRLNSIKWKKRG